MSIDQSEWIRYAEDCRVHSRIERIEKELKEVLKSMIKEPRNPISDLFEGVFLSSKGENIMGKKPKFKVGDKIIGNKEANLYNFTKEGWIGTVVTVYDRRNVFGSDIEVKGENGTTYPVNSDHFDLYNPNPNYKLVITSDDGKTTTARYYEDNKKISEAKATCHEEDEFDFDTGAVIALTRAIKGVDNVEVCIKNSSELAEETTETEWDKFKNGELTFKVYQKDIETFLDVCTDDNIYWNYTFKKEKANEYTNWEEWNEYSAIYFFMCKGDNGLTYAKDKCRYSECTWNFFDPDHYPSKTKTYKGITIDGDTAYVNYEGKKIPFDIVERDGNIFTLVSRDILEFMPFSVKNSNDYDKSDIKKFLQDEFVKRFDTEFINMLTCDGFYLLSEDEVTKFYPEYKDRIKKYWDKPYWYWLRTPHSDVSYYARDVDTDGSRRYDSAYYAFGVAPACKVILKS